MINKTFSIFIPNNTATPEPQETHHKRASAQIFAPISPKMPQTPPKALLPCGCTRAHVLIQKLDTALANRSTYPSRASAFSITAPSVNESLERSDTDFDFALPSDINGKTCQFQYYLPHISTSTSDFYTDCEWIAFDVIEPNEQAETEALLFGSSGDDDGGVELPFIADDDFDYYPPPADLPYVSSDEDELFGEEGKRRSGRRKLQKKREWEEFWLERKVGRLVRVFGRLRVRGGRKAKGQGRGRRRWNFRP